MNTVEYSLPSFPKNRSDVKQFYEFLKTNSVEWQYAYETPK